MLNYIPQQKQETLGIQMLKQGYGLCLTLDINSYAIHFKSIRMSIVVDILHFLIRSNLTGEKNETLQRAPNHSTSHQSLLGIVMETDKKFLCKNTKQNGNMRYNQAIHQHKINDEI